MADCVMIKVIILQVMNHNPGLPNCMMLHKNMMVAWDSFPPQLTITLAGHIADDEYMAFGLSGEQVSTVIDCDDNEDCLVSRASP